MSVLRVDVQVDLDPFQLAVDFEVTGEIIGLFGPSGCGKTSLLESLAGLQKAASGLIELDGRVLLDTARSVFVPPQTRDIGYVPQEGLLFPHLNVEQNLRFGVQRADIPRDKSIATLERTSHLLEITPLWPQYPVTLSGGERQRVSLGRALCSQPKLLLLDEPFASLDLGLKYRLLPILKMIRDDYGIPIILVSHDPLEVLALCDHLIALHQGRVLTTGPPSQVLRNQSVVADAVTDRVQNVLRGIILGHDNETSQVQLSADVIIDTRLCEFPEGRQVWVSLPGHEILIAPELPGPLSARNTIPSRAIAIQEYEHRCVVEALFGEDESPVSIEITPKTRRRFRLEEGSKFYAIFKATACEVLGG